MNITVTQNPMRDPAFSLPSPDGAAPAFHRGLPGYAATPLRAAPELAATAGVGGVLVKVEASRFGLPAFKVLGASWATFRALTARLAGLPDPHAAAPASLAELAEALAPLRPLDLATATDGNHGRAVARVAAWLGLGARIFVPAGTTAARIAAIEGEGARCTVVDGTYDDAVALAAREASDDCAVIADTSWPGYEDVPRWIVEGYTTILAEIDAQLAPSSPNSRVTASHEGEPTHEIGSSAQERRRPTAVIVPVGVGSLAAAVAAWYRSPGYDHLVRLIGVEPDTADCMGASLRAGRLVEVPGPHRSIMAGLNCGLASPLAWPVVAPSYDALVAVDDDVAVAGMRSLAAAGIVSGESGAAPAGVLAAGGAGELGLGPDDVVLLLSTEGATDPQAYTAAVGRRPEDVVAG